jgi:hypothetical protein
MKNSYFKKVSKWAGNKFAEVLGGSGHSWSSQYFVPFFKENFKNHSRSYIEGNSWTWEFLDTRDLLTSHKDGFGWKFQSMISWSFETNDFKPSNQKDADLLVFRFKAIKGQKGCTVRIVHKIHKLCSKQETL